MPSLHSSKLQTHGDLFRFSVLLYWSIYSCDGLATLFGFLGGYDSDLPASSSPSPHQGHGSTLEPYMLTMTFLSPTSTSPTPNTGFHSCLPVCRSACCSRQSRTAHAGLRLPELCLVLYIPNANVWNSGTLLWGICRHTWEIHL